ncbi:hypothetical protein, partial [Dechloromonas denitrificans]|uniref:hypothetical protein n=1 Tax=Dechloromonas denitrificans TaxID=281362 RepID=UPI00196A0076
MTRHAPFASQRGVALWMLLVLLAMAGSYTWYSSSNSRFSRVHQDSQLLIRMARAKEAVIAYAVLDDKRPGRLLCPDLIGDGVSPLLSRDDCDAYRGGLPWKTLDLEHSHDSHGMPLQLVIYRFFGGDRASPPLNSDTSALLTLIATDGSSHDDIAGLIIAPRGALDPDNADTNDVYQAGSSTADGNNDIILAITRQELMAAVEKRVANEVRSCLEQHASSAANSDHRYPWPAPFSASNREGKAGSLFGRVPTTQPGSGPEAALQNSIAKLTLARTTLSMASDANQQLTALQGMGAALLEARNLFDAIFGTANQLKQAADAARGQLQLIDSSIDTAILNNRISVTEGLDIRSLTGNTDPLFDPLPELLAKLGIDVMPWALSHQVTSLDTATNASERLLASDAAKQLLAATVTPRLDIVPALTTASTAASLAYDYAAGAVMSPSDAGKQALAQTAAAALSTALKALRDSIEASRVSVLSSTVSLWIGPISSLQTTLQGEQNTGNLNALSAQLSSTKAAVDAILTGVPNVTTRRNNASSALASAILATQATPANYGQIDSASTTATSALTSLATAIAANEQVDNNVSHTSLNAVLVTYETARTNFTLQDTATPRPRQADITPYADLLGSAAVNVDLWAKIIADNAALIAPQAKANTVAAGTDPAKASVLDSSAYKTASDALSSITGKNESLQLLQAYIDNQTAANLASATTAIGETSALINTLLGQASQLDTLFSGTTASAAPIVWLTSRCDFLLPNVATWWKGNQWANTLFYQISHPLQAMPGKLTVNGAGSHRLVA